MNKHTKRFIASALIYFLFGCSLGVLAAVRPDLISDIRPVHAHLNLLGWITMMIIGVSYFVIPLFVKKKVISDGAVTLHLILANAGLIGMAATMALKRYDVLPVFAIIEVFSAYLFLFIIVATAIKGEVVTKTPDEWCFMMVEADPFVDRWATWFTQAATFYFVIGCTVGGYVALSASGWAYLRIHFHLSLLGWVTMMIYGVAYHIFPRFSGQNVKSKRLVKTNFFIANLGLVLMTASMVYAEMSNFNLLSQQMTGVSGVLEGIAAVVFVYNILPVVTSAEKTMGTASVRFVMASLSYLIFGVSLGLIMAFVPEQISILLPVHTHLNTLGFITMMIYGVGYYIIPSFAGKKLHSSSMALLQFWLANIGLIGFLLVYPLGSQARGAIIFFSLLEFLAALMFIYNIGKSIFSKQELRLQ